ncbi:probable receptor-like serine/threonine-protein kinase At5g57670 [Humulus lupulus]|uniref:probable receptor-like serine/threonine-protein kinase At5g57670 n=1 Tax=Humulus lupulus TaxID=3486 RepID=UPI002B402F10|nr:probable receptor-like serine/threonine-protein kinase At5g57670 [Humulus lupulus]
MVKKTIGVVGTESFQRPIWKCFSFEEISEGTDGFNLDNLVGKGGYVEVYKGVLRNGDEIAVERLTKTALDERKEKEFLTEIGSIGHVHRRNVLSLLGCCIDSGLYLIFQFSSIGYVASLLHGENLTPMDWKTRYNIAIGTIFVSLKPKIAKYQSQDLKKKKNNKGKGHTTILQFHSSSSPNLRPFSCSDLALHLHNE